MRRLLSNEEVKYASVNSQRQVSGTDITVSEPNFVYFISSISGASASNNATIKDINNNVLAVRGTENPFNEPMRIDDGFKVSASSSVTVHYFIIALGNN